MMALGETVHLMRGIDRDVGKLWGLTAEELAEIRRSLEELRG